MPPAFRAGCGILCSGRCRGPREAQARATCEWIGSAGPGLGFLIKSTFAPLHVRAQHFAVVLHLQ
eukprot:3904961-Alexandrium_andersonii.AAC.1